jgi:NADH-quinone oxidoreductase subunit A
MSDYLPIVVLLVLASAFAALSFVGSALLGPSSPNAAKSAPYECGIVPDREPAERFPVRFYLVAMIFIIFDIEIIFLYPWAVIFRQLALFGLVEIAVFAATAFIALMYIVSNGGLDWGPAKRLVALTQTSDRTTESTVRRIGRTGGQEAA